MWLYNNKNIESMEDMPEEAYGFIYEILHIPSGKRYLGKKVLYFRRNKKIGKRELEKIKLERKEKGIKGRAPAKKEVITESDWKTYYGSHEKIKELVKRGKPEDFKREILQFVFSKKLLTYYENKWLFLKGVLEGDTDYINDNIEGRYFRKDFS